MLHCLCRTVKSNFDICPLSEKNVTFLLNNSNCVSFLKITVLSLICVNKVKHVRVLVKHYLSHLAAAKFSRVLPFLLRLVPLIVI